MKAPRSGESAAPQRSHCFFISRATHQTLRFRRRSAAPPCTDSLNQPPRRVRSLLRICQNARATCSVVLPGKGCSRSGLSAPRSAAAAPLIGGGKLPFLALGLFALAVLAPAPDRLGAASHRAEPNNQLDDLHAAITVPRTPLDCALLNGTEPEMPKPADLAALGLHVHSLSN